MDFEKIRRSGELSDVTVIVDKTEFKLHKFPLFAKSHYFKRAIAAESTCPIIRFDNNFPGGVEVFSQVADYLYSIPISIDRKNIVALCSAACLIECDTLSELLDKRFDELMSTAQITYDLSVPLTLLERCRGDCEPWAKETRLIDKCLRCIVKLSNDGVCLPLSKADRDIVVRLPLEWIVELVKVCPSESKKSILPFVKHYVTVRVLESDQLQQITTLPSGQNQGEYQSAFTFVTKKETSPITTAEEQRRIIDEIVRSLGETPQQLPLVWLNSVYERASELRCESESALLCWITHKFLDSSHHDESIETMSDGVMAGLLERINEAKENHIKDPHLIAKLSTSIDSMVEQLRQRGTQMNEQSTAAASDGPNQKHDFNDSLIQMLDDILKNEQPTKLSVTDREELLSYVDFSRVDEETFAACKTDKVTLLQLIADASLSLCAKLRKDLEEARHHLRLAEHDREKSRPISTSSSKYRSRNIDSSYYISSRLRLPNSNSYDLLRDAKSVREGNLDYELPTRYLASASSNRYASHSSYRR